jgi:large subunit ribosomal protein L5
MTDQLKTLYKETVVPKLMDQFKYKIIHQVPKLVKVL